MPALETLPQMGATGIRCNGNQKTCQLFFYQMLWVSVCPTTISCVCTWSACEQHCGKRLSSGCMTDGYLLDQELCTWGASFWFLGLFRMLKRRPGDCRECHYSDKQALNCPVVWFCDPLIGEMSRNCDVFIRSDVWAITPVVSVFSVRVRRWLEIRFESGCQGAPAPPFQGPEHLSVSGQYSCGMSKAAPARGRVAGPDRYPKLTVACLWEGCPSLARFYVLF